MPSWKHGCICSRLSNFCLSHSWHGSLLSSWIAKGAAASLQFLRRSMPGAIFEKDLLQVASTEEESEKDTRRLSVGTTATGVPEEDDVLQELDESDEGEDINNVDDHSDGDGVAQASAQQGLLNAESEDDLEAPEVLKTESEDNLEAAMLGLWTGASLPHSVLLYSASHLNSFDLCLEESEGGHENFAGSDAGWLISAEEFYLDLFSRAFSPVNDATERDELGGSGEKKRIQQGQRWCPRPQEKEAPLLVQSQKQGRKPAHKNPSLRMPTIVLERRREESAHPSGSCSARSSELLEKQEPEPAEPEEPTERAEPAAPAEPAERAEAAGESKTKTVLTGWAKLFGGPSAADPAPRKGSKGSSKGSKGKQPTNPREVQVPKTSGKGSPPSSPEPEAREEACAQEPEPANAHQSAGAEESQPSSKASTPREESAHPSGSCSARSSELLEKQEPEPAEPEEPTERAEPAAPAEPAERAEAAGESKTKTVLTGWAKLFGGPSAADPAPRKGKKGSSKGSKGKQPTNPREVQVPKTSGKGSPPSSPEPEAREEACAQEPEPANAHHSAGAEESQPSSKASTPREESAHPSGSCSARSSELLEKQEPEPAEPEEPTERAEPAAPAEPAERAEAAGESKTKTVLTGWAKLFGGPSAADPAPRKGSKGSSKGSKGKQPTNPREVQVPKTSGKGSPPSSPEPEAREEACAQEPEPANAHQSAGAEESQPSSKAASQRDDSPHVSAESSSASSSGPPEPAKEEEPRDQAVNGPAISFEDGTNSAVPLTKAGRFEDGDGSEDLSDDRLELDTFDYRTYYLNDLRNRDSDTEPTIYGSDSESSDEGHVSKPMQGHSQLCGYRWHGAWNLQRHATVREVLPQSEPVQQDEEEEEGVMEVSEESEGGHESFDGSDAGW
ncbi:unnamed protein product [Cladocopium goreaui]|uniref:Uncharacterized protein n=1 Tax=Cladocopium goreaui TaxID=2562237 RepID=A0A9P1M5V6_9DINO|nr:unnamed protein product [Cladocopium goreaui]